MTRRTAQSFGNAGIILIILAVVIPMAWVGLGVRWFLACGLLVAGGICTGVSRWLLRKPR